MCLREYFSTASKTEETLVLINLEIHPAHPKNPNSGKFTLTIQQQYYYQTYLTARISRELSVAQTLPREAAAARGA